MKHLRNNGRGAAMRAPVHVKPCVCVYHHPQTLGWYVSKEWLRRDGLFGRDVCSVSSRTVALNIGRRLAAKYGVQFVIGPETPIYVGGAA